MGSYFFVKLAAIFFLHLSLCQCTEPFVRSCWLDVRPQLGAVQNFLRCHCGGCQLARSCLRLHSYDICHQVGKGLVKANLQTFFVLSVFNSGTKGAIRHLPLRAPDPAFSLHVQLWSLRSSAPTSQPLHFSRWKRNSQMHNTLPQIILFLLQIPQSTCQLGQHPRSSRRQCCCRSIYDHRSRTQVSRGKLLGPHCTLGLR